MSTDSAAAVAEAPQKKPAPVERPVAAGRPSIVIQDEGVIPCWVVDLESFRRWSLSDDFPETGRYAWIDGDVWVDLAMEQLFTHNQLKSQFYMVLGGVVERDDEGYFFTDGVRWSHPAADLSTEADGLYVSFESLESGKVKLIEGKTRGYIEIEGSADAALEVVSPSSVEKDVEVLPKVYHAAGVTEFFLVNALGDELEFNILRWTKRSYRRVAAKDGWMKSTVFNREFRLTVDDDRNGNPRVRLEVREIG